MIFKDREDAGLKVAEKLSWLKNKPDAVIIAIPRGGVVVAGVVAGSLNISLDVVVPRKLGAPRNAELAIGGVMHDGSYHLNDYVINALNVSQQYIQQEIEVQVRESRRRLSLFRGNTDYDLRNKTVVLVDDGIATGATTLVAIMWLKKERPNTLILAVPVAPAAVSKKLHDLVDKLVILNSPLDFGAVGEFYDNFAQLNDDDVTNVLTKYRISSRT